MDSLWFTPVCDDLLKTVAHWHARYDQGEIESDRKWLNLDGVVIDRPTRYAHRLAFRPVEIQHLLRIMTALAPTSEVTKEITKLHGGLKRGRLLPGGKYLVTVAYWKEDVAEILEALIRAKTGQLETFDQLIKKQKQDGKELFEV